MSEFRVVYSERLCQYVVAANRAPWCIVPSVVSEGTKHADPRAERRAPQLADALNKIYGAQT